MRTVVLVGIIGLTVGPVGAWGQVYKCGNTFSDKPCGTNAVQVRNASEGSSAGPSGEANRGLPDYVTTCLNAIRAQVSFVDKEALRVDGHSKKWALGQRVQSPVR